jgi:hypothetical protein
MKTNNLAYLNAMGIQTWQLKNKEEPIVPHTHTDLMVVGETSDTQSGQLLDAMLQAIGFERSTVYMPSSHSSLEEQLAQVKPKVILVLGQILACELLNNSATLEQLRKNIHNYHHTALIVTYHPSDLLQDLSNKRKTFEDLQLVLKTLASKE